MRKDSKSCWVFRSTFVFAEICDNALSHRNHTACVLVSSRHRRHRAMWRSSSLRARCMWQHHGWLIPRRTWAHHASLRKSLLRYVWHHLDERDVEWLAWWYPGCCLEESGKQVRVLSEVDGMVDELTFLCRLAPPLPRPLPPLPPITIVNMSLIMKSSVVVVSCDAWNAFSDASSLDAATALSTRMIRVMKRWTYDQSWWWVFLIW